MFERPQVEIMLHYFLCLCAIFVLAQGSAMIERKQNGDITVGLPCQAHQRALSKSKCQCTDTKQTIFSKRNELLDCRDEKENLKISGCKFFITVASDLFEVPRDICKKNINEEEEQQEGRELMITQQIDVWDYTLQTDWMLFYKSSDENEKLLSFESSNIAYITNRSSWDGLLIKLALKCNECLLIKFVGNRTYPLDENLNEILHGMTTSSNNSSPRGSVNSTIKNHVIIGVIVLVALLFVALVLLVYCCYRRRKRGKSHELKWKNPTYTVQRSSNKHDENQNEEVVALVDMVDLIEETSNNSGLSVTIPIIRPQQHEAESNQSNVQEERHVTHEDVQYKDDEMPAYENTKQELLDLYPAEDSDYGEDFYVEENRGHHKKPPPPPPISKKPPIFKKPPTPARIRPLPLPKNLLRVDIGKEDTDDNYKWPSEQESFNGDFHVDSGASQVVHLPRHDGFDDDDNESYCTDSHLNIYDTPVATCTQSEIPKDLYSRTSKRNLERNRRTNVTF